MDKPITIALAGNPNCGKTTIFNHLTGAHQHVGNYPGITVDKKTGLAHREGMEALVIDLPGTYSLTAYSQEEVVSRRTLAEERPDVVVQVLDAGALERNLYLTVQLMELGIPVALGLNMMDEVRRRGDAIDAARLAVLLDAPVVECVGRVGIGLTALLRAAVTLAKDRKGQDWRPLRISYGPDLDPVLESMTAATSTAFDRNPPAGALAQYPPRWLALKYLEGDQDVRDAFAALPEGELREELETRTAEVARHLETTLHSYPEAVIADFRYGYINSVLKNDIVTRHADAAGRRNLSDKLDRVLTHALLGPLFMVGVFYLVYSVAFELGNVPMGWVDGLFGLLSDAVAGAMDEGPLRSMLVDGAIAGVGGVLVFVPLILIMFLLIAFLEDSGYMARAAYMLDRVFRIFGLHGSSVMPYVISGGIAGGCAVPGIMATRTLRSPKEKLATMLTLPFMTCGAKIPVFILFVGVFFAPEHQATAMLGITLAGWLLALLAARLLRSTIIQGPPTPFVMELPPYRLPTLRGLLLHTWERGWQYVKKAGTIILAISILMWAAMTFPAPPEFARGEHDTPYSTESADALRYSLAGRIGAALEPVSSLAGFSWQTNVALLGGFTAKEVLVSTLGTAYALGDVAPDAADSLAGRIAADPDWNLANALSLMLFVLVYAPCAATMAALRRETGGWKWPLFSLVFSTALAYILAVIVYQCGRLLL